jgi:hypothetical protein
MVGVSIIRSCFISWGAWCSRLKTTMGERGYMSTYRGSHEVISAIIFVLSLACALVGGFLLWGALETAGEQTAAAFFGGMMLGFGTTVATLTVLTRMDKSYP